MLNHEIDKSGESVPSETDFAKAATLHSQGKLPEAESMYHKILEANPTHAAANHNLGVLLVQHKKAGVGLNHLKAALEQKPNEPQHWLSYIEGLRLMGQLGKAREILQRGRAVGLQGGIVDELENKLKQPDIVTLQQLASQFNAGQWEMAERNARLLIEQYPLHGFAWKALGAVLHKTGRLDEALTAKRQAAALLPNDAEVHNNLGNLYLVLGQLDAAKQSL